jgi:aminoglycoside phosphotransferase (APT) family kinase protein
VEGLVREALNVHDTAQVERFLARPQIKKLVAGWIGGDCRVEPLSDAPERGAVYKVHSDRGVCVVRFPASEGQEAALRKESRIAQALRPLVRLALPEPAVFSAESGRPAFAVHRWIDGGPLTTEMYVHMAEEARHKLAQDLAEFLATVHSVDLAEAATWYSHEKVEHLTPPNYGKPGWFDGNLRSRIPAVLNPRLEPNLVLAVTEIVRDFEALTVSGAELVFGHGDIHGYNLAMRPTANGYELSGVFDFELAGVQDVHEDFFRLHFVASDLVERTVGAYDKKRGHKVTLDRARIRLYWRAFLIYLMLKHLEMGNLDLFQLYKGLLVETVRDDGG